MRINTRVVMDWNGNVLERESFEYQGPVALCDRSTSKKIANQGIANSEEDQTNAQSALAQTNKSLGDYSSNLSKFMQYGRDTYGANGEFMKDQNTVANTTAAAGSNAIKGNLALNAMRTGANTAGYADTVAESQRSADRDLTSQLAGADASRLSQLTNINQFGVQASALPAQVQAQLYGTSTGGANEALGVGQRASAADQSFADTLPGDLTAAIGAAGQVGAGFAKGCWIAAAVFGEDFGTGEKTNLVRNWLWEKWIQRWYAPPVLWLYSKVGRRASKSRVIVRLLTPLFHRALREAINA